MGGDKYTQIKKIGPRDAVVNIGEESHDGQVEVVILKHVRGDQYGLCTRFTPYNGPFKGQTFAKVCVKAEQPDKLTIESFLASCINYYPDKWERIDEKIEEQ